MARLQPFQRTQMPASPTSIGEALGTGLGTGLQQLAEQNLQNILSQNEEFKRVSQGEEFWKNLLPPGTNPELIKGLAGADMGLQKEVFDRLEGLEIGGGKQPGVEEGDGSQFGGVEAGQPSIGGQPEEIGVSGGVQPDTQPGGLKIGLSKAERIRKADRDVLEKKQERLDAKESREWYKPYKEKSKESERLLLDFKGMAEGARSGKLKSGPVVRIAQALGFPAKDFLSNSPSQIFDKMAADVKLHLARVALPAGTRITNMIEQLIGQTVAGREMDTDSIETISEIGARAMELEKLESESAKKHFNAWNGKVPWNADVLIENDIKADVDRLNKEMEELAFGLINKPSEGLEYNTISNIPTLKPGQRVWDNLKKRYLTDSELQEMGYGS